MRDNPNLSDMDGRPKPTVLKSFAELGLKELPKLKFSKSNFRLVENFERFNSNKPFDWEPETSESTLLSYLAVKKSKYSAKKDSLILMRS